MFKPKLNAEEIESVCRFDNVEVVVVEDESTITIHACIRNNTDKPIVQIDSKSTIESDIAVKLNFMEVLETIEITAIKMPKEDKEVLVSTILEVINLIMTKIRLAGYLYKLDVEPIPELLNIYRLLHYNIIIPDYHLFYQYVGNITFNCCHESNSVALVELKQDDTVICSGRLVIDSYETGRTYYEVGNVARTEYIDIRNNFMLFMRICKDMSDEYNRRSLRELYDRYKINSLTKSTWRLSRGGF